MRRLTATDAADLTGQCRSTIGVKRRLSRRLLLLACLVTIVVVIAPASAEAHRPPTRPELKALTITLAHLRGGGTKPASVVISTRAPGWAAVEWGSKRYKELTVFHKIRSGWQPTGWLTDPGQSRDGFCAYVPAAVVADLFGVVCPPYRALHALYASPALRTTLTTALRADPTTHFVLGGSPFHLTNACVSRLDRNWAGGILVQPDTSTTVWFHKLGSRWQPVYYNGEPPGAALPPRAVILSLARCVGYPPGEYGA